MSIRIHEILVCLSETLDDEDGARNPTLYEDGPDNPLIYEDGPGNPASNITFFQGWMCI